MISVEKRRLSDDEYDRIYASGSTGGMDGKKYEEASSQFVSLKYDADDT